MKEDKYQIKIENVTKGFQINTERNETIKQTFLNLFKPNSYKNFKALDNINVKIQEGDFIGIVGRNGSGKSTLLKIVSGIYSPDVGSIDVRGSIVPFLELGVGFNPELTARENIFLNGTILGLTRAAIKEKFDKIVAFAQINDFIDTPVKNFSSGMYVRLAFAIAIEVQSDIYILDEVLAVGDLAFQQKCIAALNKLIAQKKTVIYVSHDLESIKEYCNRVLYMEKGKVIMDGRPREVVDKFISDMHLD